MEVEIDEIISAEELKELAGELQVEETKTENTDSDVFDQLNAEIIETEEKLEVKTEKAENQAFSEEISGQDFADRPLENSIFKEDLFTETEVALELSGISDEHKDSINARETSKDVIPSDEIGIQITEEKVILKNCSDNEESVTVEKSGESLGAIEGELSAKDDGIKIDYFTPENNDIDNNFSGKQECKAVESEDDNFIQDTEINILSIQSEEDDLIAEAEKREITSNAKVIIDDELRLEDYKFDLDIASQDNVGEKIADNIKAVSTNVEKNVNIFQDTNELNHSEDKSVKHNITHSTTYQNSERHNTLKEVKIDSEMIPANEESVIISANPKSSSISELKKELMSFSDLIKSTPTKLKSSTEVRNH